MRKLTKMSLAMGILSVAILFSANVQAAVKTGESAPNFKLKDTHGKMHSLSDFKGQYVVLEWFNPDCPFVKKHYDHGDMQRLQKAYTDKGVVWLSINSSAKGKQGYYSPKEYDQLFAGANAHPTAILLDHKGKVGRLYGAKTTPHIFIIHDGTVIYQGAIDSIPSANPGDVARAENYVQLALDAAIAGRPVKIPSTKSYGCSVKY